MPNYKVFHLEPGEDRQPQAPLSDEFVEASFNGKVEGAVMAGFYRKVTHVEWRDLAQVFPLTNHIEHDWTTNEGVLLHAGRCRSTSAGDLVLDKAGELHACAMFG